jgi:hypothetical protein
MHAFKEKKYLPVFRLSDGEFSFILGNKFNFTTLQGILIFLGTLKKIIWYQSSFISSGRPGYCEHYKFWQYKKAKSIFENSIKYIAKRGLLCFNFSDSKSMSPFFYPFVNYMKKKYNYDFGDSYSLMYFVYALLFGPTGKKIIKDSNILIITSDMNIRNKQLEKGLYELGAKQIEFYYTSLNQPLFDIIDHSKITLSPDLILIGAGVGASNILVQCEKYNCPCIDCGFFVDVIGSNLYIGKRNMTVCDEDWDNVYGNNIPEWHPAYQSI